MRYDPEQVTAAFNRLFSTYPQFGTGDFEEAMRAYFEAIEPYETQDIAQAVKNFLTGSAPGVNPAFAPSAPMVGAECRRVMNLRLEAEQRARRPLPVPQIEHSPESRARVLAMVEDLKRRTAEQMRTEEAESTRRRAEGWARTNARFYPDMDPDAVRRRLGFRDGSASAAADGDAA